jgi:type II secretory pathway component PulK
MTRSHAFRRNEGAALITVLGLLVVFMMLGMTWVGFMLIENQQSGWDIENLRANYAAQGGINAAIETVRTAVTGDGVLDLTVPIELELPVYRDNSGEGESLDPSDRQVCRVLVQISDEAARVNINHAPPNVLREILSIDGEKAREIRSKLPRLDDVSGDEDGARRWFTRVDELVTRGLLAPDALPGDVAQMLTVYTVPDPANASGYMNVNTASGPVLEALLDITPDMAAQVINARPFGDVTELSAAAGKDPATFNVRPAPDALNSLPAELSFTSRCYRMVSTAKLVDTYDTENSAVLRTARIEAVVCIDGQGNARIMYWNESAGRDTTESAPESAPESPVA